MQRREILLTDLAILDVERREISTPKDIRIKDGIIREVVSSPAHRSDAYCVHDFNGYWAVPGLVDMHCHLTFEPRAHYNVLRHDYNEPEEIRLYRAIQNLTEAGQNGICLVRDVGEKGQTLRRITHLSGAGSLLLPEIVECGTPLCMPGGHGSLFGSVAPSNVNEVDQFLDRHSADGYEWLKVMNGPELWANDILSGTIDRAHRRGLRVAVHTFTPEGIRSSLLAEADTIEHAALIHDSDQEIARQVGTLFVPTLYCSSISLSRNFIVTQAPQELEYLVYWREYLSRCIRPHLKSGLPLMIGTDAGCAPCAFHDIFDELCALQDEGLDPFDLLISATIKAAEVLRRSELFGSIRAGKWANLILVPNNPLENIDALRRPDLVLYKGIGINNRLGAKWH